MKFAQISEFMVRVVGWEVGWDGKKALSDPTGP